MTEKRSRPSRSAASATSRGHDRNVRCCWKVECPYPGRSNAITRGGASSVWMIGSLSANSSRQVGDPWQYRTGWPSGAPYSAYPSSRPSARCSSPSFTGSPRRQTISLLPGRQGFSYPPTCQIDPHCGVSGVWAKRPHHRLLNPAKVHLVNARIASAARTAPPASRKDRRMTSACWRNRSSARSL